MSQIKNAGKRYRKELVLKKKLKNYLNRLNKEGLAGVEMFAAVSSNMEDDLSQVKSVSKHKKTRQVTSGTIDCTSNLIKKNVDTIELVRRDEI